ncbi:MAG: SRPBCC domain-containing protein [Williamsia sp.]|nr:SRPBCC domain-containing protein [Williamsia sp.]
MENKDVHLEVEKSYPVGVDELYDGWVNPEKLKQWWKPAGNQLREVEIDLKEGGQFRYVFETKDGEEDLKITGDYKEVTPKKKLVYSWNWELPHTQAVPNNEFQLTVEFLAEQDSSKLKVTQENFKDQESIHPHQEGWNKALDDLGNFLA